MELRSSRDLLVWLVDVWESGSPRAETLARGDSLLDLAVAEEKIQEGPPGLMDGIGQWCEDLRKAGWLTYDDTDAVKAHMPGDLRRSRNDVLLSRNFVVTAAAATFVKSSLTAASVGQVSVDLAALVRQAEHEIASADAPEETKAEARRWLTKLGEPTITTAAGELIVSAIRAAIGLR